MTTALESLFSEPASDLPVEQAAVRSVAYSTGKSLAGSENRDSSAVVMTRGSAG